MTNDHSQIETALARLFDDDQQRIVFWNDPEPEFLTTRPFVFLPEGVTILKLDEIGVLEAKVRLERDDPAGRYRTAECGRRDRSGVHGRFLGGGGMARIFVARIFF